MTGQSLGSSLRATTVFRVARLNNARFFAVMHDVTCEKTPSPGDLRVPAAGGGLRLLLNKHSRTNLCVDYGWGAHGSLGIQEAF